MDTPSAVVLAGMGIFGDRHFGQTQWNGQNVTLIEAEQIETVNRRLGLSILPWEPRRNLVTRGIRLNSLVNSEFCLGPVRLRGVELCDPCIKLAQYLAHTGRSNKSILQAFLGRGGLRCICLEGGEISVGMEILTSPPA